jgi:hypothetical protein
MNRITQISFSRTFGLLRLLVLGVAVLAGNFLGDVFVALRWIFVFDSSSSQIGGLSDFMLRSSA